VTVVIKQTPTDLTIETQAGANPQKATYSLDGKESVNAGARGSETKTKTRWDGSTLITEGSRKMNTPDGEIAIELKEARSLSADGNTMTVQQTTKGPRGEQTRKTIFNKKS